MGCRQVPRELLGYWEFHLEKRKTGAIWPMVLCVPLGGVTFHLLLHRVKIHRSGFNPKETRGLLPRFLVFGRLPDKNQLLEPTSGALGVHKAKWSSYLWTLGRLGVPQPGICSFIFMRWCGFWVSSQLYSESSCTGP